MSCSRRSVYKPSCRLDNYIYPQVLPWQFFRLFNGKHPYLFSINCYASDTGLYISMKNAMYRVVFKEMGKCLCIGKIINRNNLKFIIPHACPEKKSSYSSKAVNCNAH